MIHYSLLFIPKQLETFRYGTQSTFCIKKVLNNLLLGTIT